MCLGQGHPVDSGASQRQPLGFGDAGLPRIITSYQPAVTRLDHCLTLAYGHKCRHIVAAALHTTA